MKHPLLEKRLTNFHFKPLTHAITRFLSTGGINFFISNSEIKTKLSIYNYFALLNGDDFLSMWRVTLISQDGKKKKVLKGNFKKKETVMLELDPHLNGMGEVGLCVVHVSPIDKAQTLKNSYTTVSFVEYTNQWGGTFIHSFGYPVPKIYNANNYMVSSLHPEAEPMIILSNSCDRVFRTPQQTISSGPKITIVNHKKETREVELPPIRPLASQLFKLFPVWPDIISFLDDAPAYFHIQGPNVIYSPLFMQMLPNGSFTVEHLQGLDWEDFR